MNKTQSTNNMSNTYIISDLHFGHRNICNYRPNFSSMEEHDAVLLENCLKTVTKRDTLWLLGDCFFTVETVEYLKALAQQAKHVNFIPGNHDTDTAERVRIFKECVNAGYFNQVGSLLKLRKKFWLSHGPIHPQELYGKMNIHGHVHRKSVPDDSYLNVSAENIGFVPVNVNQLIDESSRREVLEFYGEGYEHDCSTYVNAHHGTCLVCGRGRD